MKYIDPKLGVPLPERDYGGNCLMYDPGNTTDPFHNIWVRLFVLFYYHFIIYLSSSHPAHVCFSYENLYVTQISDSVAGLTRLHTTFCINGK